MGGYIYILTNVNFTTLYIGVTSDLPSRIYQHVHTPANGSFTKRYTLTQVVYAEWHPTMMEAIAREKQLKKWSRKKKDALISASNANWRDLAEWHDDGEQPTVKLPKHHYGKLDVDDD